MDSCDDSNSARFTLGPHRRNRGGIRGAAFRPLTVDDDADSCDDSNSARFTLGPHRRNGGGTRGDFLPLPVDDDADPNPAAGHPPRELPPERLPLDEHCRRVYPRPQFPIPALSFLQDWFPAHRPRPSATRSQASSSAALPSRHPAPKRTGSGTRFRQSVLYSDHRRRPRRRRPTEHVEHPSEVSSSELEVTNLCEMLSVSDSTAFPSETEEHPSKASSTELSLTEPPLLTPQTAEESEDDAEVSEDDEAYFPSRHEPIQFGIGSFGPQTLCYSDPSPQFEWSEGVPKRGQATLEELAAVRSSAELGPSRSEALSRGSNSSCSPKSTEKNPTKDSDDDTEEELRLFREYIAAHTYTSLREGFDAIIAVEHAILTERAAKNGTEPPPPLPAKHLPVHQETQSSSATAQPQHSTAPRKPRCEASNAELAENAEKWMLEEVKMVFENYIERRDDLKGFDFCFNELCHQCFNVEHYNKIFHHYNFTVRMKPPNSVDWVVALYFAEVKQMFGRKYYFCCELLPNENGHCHACKSQGVEDLQHPVTGGFEGGSPNVGFDLWYE